MKSRVQVLMIHGGMTFRKKREYFKFLRNRPISIEKKTKWNDGYIDKKLGKKFEIIKLRMPNSDDAKYQEWKIHFERYFPFLKNNIILIGISLGGIFLAKYLSENKFPKKILSTYLVCPPFDDSIPNEDLAGGFKLKSDLSLIEKNSPVLKLLFSKDDDVVPISHCEKYKGKLKYAEVIIFENKNGHFKIQKFPEIVKMVKRDLRMANNIFLFKFYC